MLTLKNTCHGALALLLLASACGDDKNAPIDAPVIDAKVVDAYVPQTTYRQIEFLGRPAIAEALLITPAYLEGYNATAPSFAGAPPAAVTAITAEAKTVLKAIYLGTCLLNGVAGLTAANGATPSGLQCAAVGGAIFMENSPAGVTLTAAAAAGAQAYADRVFSQFETDVLRIDTSMPSGYLLGGASLCAGAASNKPLLCGGRMLNEDVVDITYFYLLSGAAVPTAAANPGPVQNQVLALVSDGVEFSGLNSENSGNNLPPDPNNTNQFKQSCRNCGPNRIAQGTFPYSAPPR